MKKENINRSTKPTWSSTLLEGCWLLASVTFTSDHPGSRKKTLWCVCVCVNLCTKEAHLFFQKQAGGQPREHSWLPNEEDYATTDLEADHLHVPARKKLPFLQFLFHQHAQTVSGTSGSSCCSVKLYCWRTYRLSVEQRDWFRLTENYMDPLPFVKCVRTCVCVLHVKDRGCDTSSESSGNKHPIYIHSIHRLNHLLSLSAYHPNGSNTS